MNGYEGKLRSENLHHDPTLNLGLEASGPSLPSCMTPLLSYVALFLIGFASSLSYLQNGLKGPKLQEKFEKRKFELSSQNSTFALGEDGADSQSPTDHMPSDFDIW
ncbi:hypothetical protein CR513_19400, partial [Mucuna pruriens]